MFSKELEEFIDSTLADGVLTDKERNVLHKRAQAEGVDPDELDVYIDGLLVKLHVQRQNAKAQVRKCPACGDIIPALSNVCPSCGEIVNYKSNDDLKKSLETLQEDLVNLKTLSFDSLDQEDSYIALRAKFEEDIRITKAYYSDDSKVKSHIFELERALGIKNREFENWKKTKVRKRILKWIITLIPPIILTVVNIIGANTPEAIENDLTFGFPLYLLIFWGIGTLVTRILK